MAKYECCGLEYQDSKALTDHVRADHLVEKFDVSLACCGTTFVDSKQLSQHMKSAHKIPLNVQL